MLLPEHWGEPRRDDITNLFFDQSLDVARRRAQSSPSSLSAEDVAFLKANGRACLEAHQDTATRKNLVGG